MDIYEGHDRCFNTCPLCDKTAETIGYGNHFSMNSFPHELNCPYLIAKDLSTNVLPQPPKEPKSEE